MTFPLIGESYGALAAQQQNYDQMANAINAANRAAFMQTRDRDAELAFRARELANRDALNMAQQEESRFRFGVERQLQERARRDQLAAQQAQAQEQRFQFGKQLDLAKEKIALEKARMAADDSGKADEEAMLYSEQLGRLREESDQATQARQELAAHIEKLNAARPTVVNPLKFTAALSAAQKELAAAAKNEAKLKATLDRALTTYETRGLRGGFKVDRPGQRIVTPGGGAYRFGPVTEPEAEAVPRVTRAGEVLNPDGSSAIPQISAQRVRSDIDGELPTGAATPPDDRPEFTGPPRPAAAAVRYNIPEVQPQGEYTGFLPAVGRLAVRGAKLAVNAPIAYARGVSRAMGVAPAAARNVWRGARDLAIMPPVGSPEYNELMRERAEYDARVREFAFPPPSYF